jgi:hypothetical protein
VVCGALPDGQLGEAGVRVGDGHADVAGAGVVQVDARVSETTAARSPLPCAVVPYVVCRPE